ncbi:MAG: long-chain fatty acid--CoA ligase [Mycobacterium sp.]
MLVSELIRAGARRHRDRIAVRYEAQTWTFADVADLAERAARALLAETAGPGTRVALLLDNGPLSLPVDFALALGGFVRVPLNSRLSVDEHVSMVAGASCTVLLFEARQGERARGIAERVTGLRLIAIDDTDGVDSGTDPLVRLAHRQPSGDPMVPVGPDDPVLAVYTSGTTGQLKAAVHTQASWGAITTNILANLLSPGPDDVMLHSASLIHASGTFVLPFWIRGAGAAILPRFTPDLWFDAAKRHEATFANLVPTMLQMLLAEGGRVPPARLSTIVYGASPMPRPVITQALSEWGPRFVQYYGQTEAPLCITVLDKTDHVGADSERLLGSCGQPSVDVQIRLCDGDGEMVPEGEPGEMQVRAPFAMRGYLDAPELSAATVLRDGWISTRDIARRDERGYLYLVDRTSDMIVTGGYNVYPREVEDALLDHPEVYEAAVVAAPDPQWVEAVTAFVVAAPGTHPDEQHLRAHVRDRLAAYKVPKRVVFVDEIPKSAVGKVLRRVLRAPLWGENDNAGAKR